MFSAAGVTGVVDLAAEASCNGMDVVAATSLVMAASGLMTSGSDIHECAHGHISTVLHQ